MPSGIYTRTIKQKRKMSIARKGKKHSEETKKKIGLGNKGKIRTEEHKRKNSEAHKGKGHPQSEETKKKLSKIKKGIKFSEEHRKNLKISHLGQKSWNKGMKFPERSGTNHFAWKGGITPINEKIRKSLEYKLWREVVFKRDNWTCRFCGQQGGKLQADHIKRFSDYPELRFAIDNGRTLCISCHRKTDTYGRKKLY